MLGSGQFGDVYKTIDVDSGKMMAVKVIKQPVSILKQALGGQQLVNMWSREIEALFRSQHPHIVDYPGANSTDGIVREIFVGLKDGELGSLALNCAPSELSTLAYDVCDQMLQALDFLAVRGIVHRDLKPENILYDSLEDGTYRFQLGDFGLSNRTVDAVSYVGSPLYMAPEVLQYGTQTPQMDVWSLIVTIVWTMDVHKFRSEAGRLRSLSHIHKAIVKMAETSKELQTLREMAIIDPNKRATAAQILLRRLDGKGLTTHRDQIVPLPGVMSVIATNCT